MADNYERFPKNMHNFGIFYNFEIIVLFNKQS